MPRGAEVIDAAGHTVVPGFRGRPRARGPLRDGDAAPGQLELLRQPRLRASQRCTTPRRRPRWCSALGSLSRRARSSAPRVYSTGSILYGADGDIRVQINSLDDARSHLRRLKAVGAFFGQELQPAAEGPTPAGPGRRARARHAGDARGRLDVLPQRQHGDRRPHRHRARHRRRAALPRRAGLVGRDGRGLHADAGRRLTAASGARTTGTPSPTCGRTSGCSRSPRAARSTPARAAASPFPTTSGGTST